MRDTTTPWSHSQCELRGRQLLSLTDSQELFPGVQFEVPFTFVLSDSKIAKLKIG
jgi:hypothetical protein